jgi:dephospho-CoA kinase
MIIGVTGNTGSGKSTVCLMLSKLGAAVIDADKLAHETYSPHSRTWQKLVASFGESILTNTGKINRRSLRQIVFADQQALAMLNRIVHPAARELAQKKIRHLQAHGAKVIALEAALLIEADWLDLVNTVWLVTATETVIRHRLEKRPRADSERLEWHLKTQLPVSEKMKYADEVIHNNGDLARLAAKVSELWRRMEIGGTPHR